MACEFGTIGVCDGIAMGHVGMKYSLPSRDLIADSIEIVALAHALDGLVLVVNCDKIVPGMLMAAARLDIPSVILSGGPMLAGSFDGRDVGLEAVFEAVGRHTAGRMTDKDSFMNGSGDSKSISEPMIIDMTPPIARMPWEMIFISRMKRIMASMIRSRPA